MLFTASLFFLPISQWWGKKDLVARRDLSRLEMFIYLSYIGSMDFAHGSRSHVRTVPYSDDPLSTVEKAVQEQRLSLTTTPVTHGVQVQVQITNKKKKTPQEKKLSPPAAAGRVSTYDVDDIGQTCSSTYSSAFCHCFSRSN